MCSHYIQDFSSSASSERIRAEHRQSLIGDSLVKRFFVFTEVLPVLLSQPRSIPGHPYACITSCRRGCEFLVPTANHSVEIESAILEIPVASRDNLYTLVRGISIEVRYNSF